MKHLTPIRCKGCGVEFSAIPRKKKGGSLPSMCDCCHKTRAKIYRKKYLESLPSKTLYESKKDGLELKKTRKKLRCQYRDEVGGKCTRPIPEHNRCFCDRHSKIVASLNTWQGW